LRLVVSSHYDAATNRPDVRQPTTQSEQEGKFMLIQFSRPALVIFAAVMSSIATAQDIVRPPEPPMPDPEMPSFTKGAVISDAGPKATTNASWPGMFQTGTGVPPDPHGCAGSNGILQAINLRLAYYNKLGVASWGPVNFSTFFAPVGNTGSGNSDPKALYDHNANRFYVILQENFSTNQSWLNVAVSKSPNPASSTTADWYLYRFSMLQTVGGTNYGADYPGLGFDSQAIYVTYNMYPLPFGPSSGFKNSQIIILNKAAFLSGTATYYRLNTPDGSANAFTLQPATVMSASDPGNVAYFGSINFANNTSVKFWSVTNPIGSGASARILSQSTITVPNHGGFISTAPQPSPGAGVPTLSPRTQGNAFYHNGSVWFAHTAGGSSGRAIIYYYRVNANGFPVSAPTLNESGSLDGGAGVSQYQPGIGGNRNGDVCIVFTRSATNINPTMMATVRTAGAGTFDAPVTIKPSPTYSNSSRWGDYASVTPDPVNNTFWVTHEWARSATLSDWGTWWANVSSVAVPNSPPTITTQPASITRLEGQSATFNVNAGGTGPLYYQWRKNGLNLPGANGSSYNIPSVVLGDAGGYSVVITNLFGTNTSSTATLTVNPVVDSVVYMRSIVGSPWNSSGNETALDLAFGAGNWQNLTFEEANVASVFAPNIRLVFMDGSDDGAQEMESFLTANRVLIQNWVAAGGSLVLNSAPNEGDGMYFGFGVGLTYQELISSGTAVLTSHPIFNGPFTPVGTSWTGGYFAHAWVSGTDLLPLIVNPANGHTILGEKTWGLGRVLFGGMTTPNFHSPSPNAANLRANILAYAGAAPYKPFAYLRSSVAGEPWSSAVNTNSMNRVFGTDWSNLQYETVVPGSLFTPATKFIFMEGSQFNADELEAFLMANSPAISNWVSLGGSLLLNAAPNEGNGMSFGFGASLNYSVPTTVSETGTVAVGASAHAIFNGPYLPVGTTWTANDFAHATVSGAGLTSLIVNSTNSGMVLLASKTFGSGCLLFGGMTTPNFHSPSIEATNLRANMIAFGRAWATNFPPVINVQPLTQSALIGQTVTLNVNASGTPPLSYQWRKNGVNITGANAATYTIPAVTAAAAGVYSVFVSNPHGSVLSSNATLSITLAATGSVVYLRSTVGMPWGRTSNETNMNTAFSVGNWQDLRYETVDVAALLSPTTKFIFMEGSDDNALEMGLFLSNNIVAIENWVSRGGSVLINCAPNEGEDQSLGFGVTLAVDVFSSAGSAADPLHPIFNGPFLPVGTSWTGGSFGHATVSGSGLTELITNSAGGIVLGGKPWGSGYALFGGMTLTFYHNPDPQSDNLRANILSYAGAQAAEAMPPMIVVQPQSRTNGYLQPISFSVSAVGTLPLTYQWRKNGANISSGTNSTLGTLAINSGDEYSVVVANAFGSVLSASAILTVTNVFLGNVVYLRSTVGMPWGKTDNETAMNAVFGAGNWLDQRYETVNVGTLLSASTRFIFMEGSDSIANELETFLNANRTAIQNWVSAGGLLFVNSAPNEGDGMNLGFGVTLNYGAGSSGDSAGAVRLANPIFNGPFLPVGTAWSGNSFSHSYVTGGGLISLITNEFGRIVLGEKTWGLGRALFGGMTMPYFHDPDPEAADLRANILAYLSTARSRAAYVRSTVGAPWGVNRNEVAMDRVFGPGSWQDLRFETLNVASLLSTNTKFIFFEGSDFGADEMENFMTNYVAAVESWVSEGGHVFINSAPNEGDGLNFGFGVLLTNRTFFLNDGTAAMSAHPIFNGPFLPVGTAWTGNYFAHGFLEGPDLLPVITNAPNGNVILAEKQIGQGHILFGSMTTDNWQDPDPQAENLRANILAYGSSGLGSYCYSAFGTIYLTNVVSSNNIAAANPYPSTINIAGVPGLVSKVTVTLSNITHTWPADLDILLVSPNGERVMLLSDITDDSLGFRVTDVTVVLDDAAPLALPIGIPLVPGTYRPTDNDATENLPAPAPVRPYATTLSRFNGQNPNGTWSLYAADDFASTDVGTIGGWKLQIITTTSRPFLLVPRRVGPNVEVTFRASTGNFAAADIPRFHIEGSSDLTTWTPLSVTLSLNGGRLQFTQPASSAYRFYRVVEP
jgi:subtilisin-like proprotein convertase family protein